MSRTQPIQFTNNLSAPSTTSEALKAIAAELNVGESKAAEIAINRLYYSLFADPENEVTVEEFLAASITTEEEAGAQRISLMDIIEATAG